MPVRLSFSKISTYMECPRKYFLSYICKMGTGSSPHMSNGSAIHKCAEDYELFDTDEVSEVLNKKFSEIFETPGKSLENLIEYYQKILPHIDKNNLVHESIDDIVMINPLFEQKAIKSLKSFYEDYHENFYDQERASTIPKILMQEDKFTLELENGNSITGLIDRVDEEPEGEHIIDYKSGQTRITYKALKDPLADKSLQLSIYALARYKKTGKIPYKASFFYVEPAKNAKKQEGQYRSANNFTKETMDKVERFLNDIGEEINKATEETNFPMGPSPNCFWCDFKNKCEILSESQINELNNKIDSVNFNQVEQTPDLSMWEE